MNYNQQNGFPQNYYQCNDYNPSFCGPSSSSFPSQDPAMLSYGYPQIMYNNTNENATNALSSGNMGYPCCGPNCRHHKMQNSLSSGCFANNKGAINSHMQHKQNEPGTYESGNPMEEYSFDYNSGTSKFNNSPYENQCMQSYDNTSRQFNNLGYGRCPSGHTCVNGMCIKNTGNRSNESKRRSSHSGM